MGRIEYSSIDYSMAYSTLRHRSQCRVRVIMLQTVNVGDARARLSHLIACAEAGEDVIIARDGVPAARIVPASGFAA